MADGFIGEGNWNTPQKPDKLYHIVLYRAHLAWAEFELTLVVIGTDCIGSCKSKYHTITATTSPQKFWLTLIRYIFRRFLRFTSYFGCHFSRQPYCLSKRKEMWHLLRFPLSSWFGLWYLRHFQQYYSYIVAVCFIGGGNQSTQRKPLTCRKSLTSFNT